MRPLLLCRQVNRHGQTGNGGLDAFCSLQGNRKSQVFDTDLIDRQIAQISAGLHVRNSVHELFFLNIHVIVEMCAWYGVSAGEYTVNLQMRDYITRF